MPKSIIEERIDAAWDDVTAAVSSGLKPARREKTLEHVVSIAAKKPSSTTWRPTTTQQLQVSQPQLGRLRLRESEPPLTVVDYEFRFPMDYDALAPPITEKTTAKITEWAAAARAFELRDVLDRLADVVPTIEDKRVGDLHDTEPSGGWGQIRCVTFKLDGPLAKSLDEFKPSGWDGPVELEMTLPRVDPPNCLLFREGGGPHLRRTAGLTLGWLPTWTGAIALVLAEQFEIVNANPQTVAAIRLLQ